MQLSFESSSHIDASPDKVWATLVDGREWPTWDSGVEEVKGEIGKNNRVVIRSKAAQGRAFPIKVTEFEPGKRMVFVGGMPFGLFRGVRVYTLTADKTGTAFHMREDYTGPMLGAISKSMPDLNPSFVQFADGLKKRVEASA